MLNKMFETGFTNRLPELFELLFGTFGSQFDLAIRQVADCSSHVKPVGHRFYGKTEADTLHAARVKDSHSPAIHSQYRAQCAIIGLFPGGKSPSTGSDSVDKAIKSPPHATLFRARPVRLEQI